MLCVDIFLRGLFVGVTAGTITWHLIRCVSIAMEHYAN